MPRLLLTDEYWSKLRPIMLDVGIYDKAGLRLTVEGILYRLRVGCPWRDLPPEFGAWNSIFKRFNDLSEKGKLNEIFTSLASAPDTEWLFIDGSISKAHQHSSGARGGESTGIGKSVAGNTSKIHMIVDSYGLPIEFECQCNPMRCHWLTKSAWASLAQWILKINSTLWTSILL